MGDRDDLSIEWVDTASFPFLRQFDKTDIRLSITPDRWREALACAWREMKSLRSQPIAQTELQRAKDALERDLRTQADVDLAGSGEDRATQLLEAFHWQDGIEDPQQRIRQARALLGAITPASFQKWVDARVDDAAWRVALVTPPGATPAPGRADLASVIDRTKQEAPEAWQDLPTVDLAGESGRDAGRPSGAEIKLTGDTTSVTLSNHMTIHCKQLDGSGKQVVFSLSIAGGADEENASTRGVTLLAAAAFESAATSDYTSLQMTDWLRAHGMTWDVSVDRNCVLLKLVSPTNETENALRFLHAILSRATLRPQRPRALAYRDGVEPAATGDRSPFDRLPGRECQE